MDQEFKLTEVKYVFYFEDLQPEETKLWLSHLKHIDEDCENSDPRKIFKTFLNNNGIDYMIIRYWTWRENSIGMQHELIDMNDNDGSGIIALDDKPWLANVDGDLTELDKSMCQEFTSRLEFFSILRFSVGKESDVPKNYLRLPSILAFRSSEEGDKAIWLSAQAWSEYVKAKELAENAERGMRDMYLHEFTFMYETTNGNKEHVEDKIGYTLPADGNKFDDVVFFKFVKWFHQSKEYVLVTIEDDYDKETYLLNEEGKIGTKVFETMYYQSGNVKEDEVGKEIYDLIGALQIRMFSYFAVENPHRDRD